MKTSETPEHPLGDTKRSSSPVPFPSPPLSPSDERDIEAFAADVPAFNYRSGDFLSQALSGTSSDRDPLLLKSKLQTEEHITELTHRRSTRSRKNLGDFYNRQNKHIHSLLKPMDKHIEENRADEDANRMAVRCPFSCRGVWHGELTRPVPCADQDRCLGFSYL